ncbi:hypothetical protein RRG08_026293 [Elysia crispata]|uniref:Uncharacterized protein n=1 Tax=Elysia crispata TaxID=231223 RepID=A0AAE1DDW6_9GAST|nr:hypothetical protein RRG08_026293 [Elysia crispata]
MLGQSCKGTSWSCTLINELSVDIVKAGLGHRPLTISSPAQQHTIKSSYFGKAFQKSMSSTSIQHIAYNAFSN